MAVESATRPTLSAIRNLFVELGYTTASDWNAERAKKKIQNLPSLIRDDTEIKTPSLKDFASRLLAALKNEEEIEVIDDSAEAVADRKKKSEKKIGKQAKKDEAETQTEEKKTAKKSASKKEPAAKKEPASKKKAASSKSEPAATKKTAKKSAKAAPEKKAAAPAAPKKVAKKTAKKTAAKKSVPKKAEGEGVIGTIVTILKAASKSKPVSKPDIVKKLAAKFKDRTADAMAKTVMVQVPGRLRRDKQLDIQQNDKGYWIP